MTAPPAPTLAERIYTVRDGCAAGIREHTLVICDAAEAMQRERDEAISARDELIAEAYGVTDGVTQHGTAEAILEIRRVRSERDELRAEVEAMRAVVDAARGILRRYLANNEPKDPATMRVVADQWRALIDALARLDAGKGP